MSISTLRHPFTLALALALAVSPAIAQETAETPAEYKIGSGDILEVVVIGNDEASRSATVSPGGTITLPLIGEVPVAGRTTSEVRGTVTQALEKDYLVNPQVEVRVKEYGSQFVLAVGEMRTPGRKALRANARLIDVLMDAGGFSAQASGDVVVTRVDGAFPDGTKTLRVRVTTTNPSAKDRSALEMALRSGDIVVAAPKAYVIVEGEVSRPGRFPIEGNLTITGAISVAGGVTRYGSNAVRLRRMSADGKTEILSVDLKAIRKGKKPDTLLQGDDVVTVPRRLF